MAAVKHQNITDVPMECGIIGKFSAPRHIGEYGKTPMKRRILVGFRDENAIFPPLFEE